MSIKEERKSISDGTFKALAKKFKDTLKDSLSECSQFEHSKDSLE